jgi:hypothetical protein
MIGTGGSSKVLPLIPLMVSEHKQRSTVLSHVSVLAGQDLVTALTATRIDQVVAVPIVPVFKRCIFTCVRNQEQSSSARS